MTTIFDVLKQYLKGDALGFACHFIEYCHMIDDIIDEPITRNNPEHILRTFELSATIYSNPFYRQNASYLLPIIKMATNAYADSIAFEHHVEEWNKPFKAVLAQQANDVVLACIELECGQAARRYASPEFKKAAYFTHKDSFHA